MDADRCDRDSCITAEALRVESRTGERAEYGLHPKAVDTQLQLSTRLQF